MNSPAAKVVIVGAAKDFHMIRPATAEILLVEAGDRLLNTFDRSLSQHAVTELDRLGVSVKLNTRVTDVSGDGVRTEEGFIAAKL